MGRCREVRVQVHQGVVVWAGGRFDSATDVWFHPAFGDSRLSYRHAFESVLSRHARILVYDPPGHGASPPRPQGFSIAQGVQLWCGLIRRFSRERGVVLVGHSMAGLIASRAALALRRSPSLVIGVEANLTRADAFFTGLAARFDEPQGFYAMFRERIRRIARRDESVNRFAWSLECADPKTLWTLGRSVFAQKDPGASFRRLRSAKIHYWDAMQAGKQTRNYIARYEIPDRRLDRLGHWPMLKQPDTFYAAIADDVLRAGARQGLPLRRGVSTLGSSSRASTHST
jgi:pimeloyl-ACP methyl ester carboxylesterase